MVLVKQNPPLVKNSAEAPQSKNDAKEAVVLTLSPNVATKRNEL